MFSEWLTNLHLRLTGLFKRRQLNRDLEDELSFHIAMLREKNRADGIKGEEADFAARRQLGNATILKERSHEMWSFPSLESFWHDIRYAARTLRKSPAFSAVAILTLAAGIGVNAGIFQIFNALALRPVELGGAQRLLAIYQYFQVQHPPMHRNVHNSENLFSYVEYKEYRDQNQVFSGLLAYDPLVEATLGGDQPRKLLGTLASCNYFEVLGIRLAMGRGFVDSDCAATGAGALVVLSDDTWKEAFAADPSVIGKNVSLNGLPLTVVGVAPPGFRGTEVVSSAFWAPLTMQPGLHPANYEKNNDMLADNDLSWLRLMGRARDDLSNGQVLADLQIISARLDQHHPGTTCKLTVSTPTFFDTPEHHRGVIGVGTVILCAVGLVLLIACANVANLLLARAATRRREIAVRLATGASRGRLVRQLLTESLLLALAGGALGSLLAFWSFRTLLTYVLSRIPSGLLPALNWNLSPDIRVLTFVLAITVVAAVAFGLAPALQATRMDIGTQLKNETWDWQGHPVRGNRMRRLLVGLQVAVSMILLLVAGLLLRGLYRAQTIDPGFAIQNVQAISFNLSRQNYNQERAAAFQRQLVERIRAIPGVESVAQAASLPLGNNHNGTTASAPAGANDFNVEFNHVSADFFAAVSIPIVRGRTFNEEETRTDAKSLIVTEAAARLFWPEKDPIGQRLHPRMPGEPVYDVVGVAKDAQVAHLGEDHPVYLYLPAGPAEQAELGLLVRPVSGFTLSQKTLRAVVASLDAELAGDVHPLADYLEFWRIPARLAAGLSAALGILALLLAAAGVYGMVCFAVSRRVHEIGIRMALGADGREVMSLILRQAMRPVFIGAVIGVICCAAVSRGLSSILFGLSSYDPVAFLAVPIFLISAALLASYLPARRAIRVDPMVALRYE
jgi:macrolide transport system ATP-binding/permease protein